MIWNAAGIKRIIVKFRIISYFRHITRLIIAYGVQLLVITALDELILQDIVDGQSAVVFPVVVLKDCYDGFPEQGNIKDFILG